MSCFWVVVVVVSRADPVKAVLLSRIAELITYNRIHQNSVRDGANLEVVLKEHERSPCVDLRLFYDLRWQDKGL